MKEGIPVIPGVLLLPSVATASTFIAGSGNTLSKSRDPSQISTSPRSQLPSSLSSHPSLHAASAQAAQKSEEGGLSLALYRPHAILHPAPSPVSAPALAAGPEQPHLPGTPSGTKTQQAPGRTDLGCCPSATSHTSYKAVWLPGWAAHGMPVMGHDKHHCQEISAQTSNPCRGASQSQEPQGGLPFTASRK